MRYKNIAFIPLIHESNSIPLKYIKSINNRPLAYWVLDAAVACEYIEKIFVSIDSEKIKKVIKAYGSDKIAVVGRSKETAWNHSSTESAMLEFAEQYEFKNIVLIQAISPLLKVDDLNKGFQLIFSGKYDSILLAVRQKRFIWAKRGEYYYPQNYDLAHRPLRQNFEGYLVENGAFYITTKERLLKSKCRISGRIGIVEMSGDTYFEIDEPEDWIIVENLLKARNKKDYSEILKNIKMLITDSDGVLTDGGMYYSEKGDELKKFNAKDGMAFKLLRKASIKTAIITGEKVDLVKKRGEKFKIDEIYLGIEDKMSVINKICIKYGIKLEEIAYIGDDINDLEAIKSVGFGCCVNDAVDRVKSAAKYITKTKGGEGAVREVAEIILGGRLCE